MIFNPGCQVKLCFFSYHFVPEFKTVNEYFVMSYSFTSFGVNNVIPDKSAFPCFRNS
jgi:hypothetical protein